MILIGSGQIKTVGEEKEQRETHDYPQSSGLEQGILTPPRITCTSVSVLFLKNNRVIFRGGQLQSKRVKCNRKICKDSNSTETVLKTELMKLVPEDRMLYIITCGGDIKKSGCNKLFLEKNMRMSEVIGTLPVITTKLTISRNRGEGEEAMYRGQEGITLNLHGNYLEAIAMGRDTNRGKGSMISDEHSGTAVPRSVVSKLDETKHSKVTARPRPCLRHASNCGGVFF
ncbi:hypothetical protein EVAR_47499_1 [Eumeta japonica]|uniref:Uncharacterized protein n=1 Tax=Eumeta variegata TaxID=151549 RepID=A0A4C1XUW4_EUMVA|nr:hypothetical protein EVAR_47499_1 [Eumeta japonica]